jgi:excisionase family DNA binding protein
MVTVARRPMEKPTFYTVEELAAMLKVSEQTIRLWIRRGRLQSFKIGRGHRIPAEEVRRLIEASKAEGQRDEER